VGGDEGGDVADGVAPRRVDGAVRHPNRRALAQPALPRTGEGDNRFVKFQRGGYEAVCGPRRALVRHRDDGGGAAEEGGVVEELKGLMGGELGGGEGVGEDGGDGHGGVEARAAADDEDAAGGDEGDGLGDGRLGVG
jgi:hypothetical protein